MMRRLLVALGTLAVSAASLAVPTAASADTEGAVVIVVDIAPRAQAPGSGLAAAGLESLPALLIALALAGAGALAVAVGRRRRARG